MAFVLGEPTVQQYVDANGDPLANGSIEFYLWNTSTPTPIYSDESGTSLGTSITLNSIGAPQSSGGTAVALFFNDSITYKITRKDADGNVIGPTIGPYRRVDPDSITQSVPSVTALKAVTTTGFDGGEYRTVIETSAGLGDGFPVVFRNSDVSSQVAADTSDEWIVPNDRASDGSTGAWQRTLVEIAPISDSETSASKVWSSEKIAAELLDAVDDAVTESAAEATAQADRAELAADAAAASGEIYDSTADALSNGVYSLDSLVAGSGGTDGTFALAFSGGAGSGAAGWFTVVSGAISAYEITARGVGYTSAPTVSFAASAGLTGASATAVISANRGEGGYFGIPSSDDAGYTDLYRVDAGPVATYIKTLPNFSGVVSLEQYTAERKNVFNTSIPYNTDGIAWAIIDDSGAIVLGVTDAGKTVGELSQRVDDNHGEINQAIADAIEPSSMPYNPTEFAWATVDSGNNVAIGVRDDGTVLVRKLDTGASLPEPIPYTGDTFVYSILDNAGNVVFGITESGKILGYYQNEIDALAARLDAVEAVPIDTITAELDGYDAQPIVFNKTVGTYQQIFAVNDTGEFEVTPDTYNTFAPVAHKDSYVKFASDMDGELKMYRKSLYADNVVKSYDNTIYHILIIGQSNTIPKGIAGFGGESVPSAGTILANAVLQFNGATPNHPWPNFFSGWTTDDHDAEIAAAEIDHFVNMSASTFESHGHGFSQLVNQDDKVFLVSGHGRGGAGYAILKKGLADTTNYAYRNSIACVQRGKDLADSLGMQYKVLLMINEHGESDAQNASYLDNLNEWVSDYNEDIKAISGQVEDIPMYLSQQQSWALGGVNSTSASVIAQLDFHEKNPLGYLVAPKYFLPHDNAGAGDGSANDGDGIHLSAYGIRTLTEYYVKAYLQGEAWSPLVPSTIVFDGVDTITVSFNGRVGDLRFSLYNAVTNPHGVVDPGNYGFELSDLGGASITAVTLSGDLTQVLITVDQALVAGAELRYAYTSSTLPADAGPQTGPRGCLCDSDPTPPSPQLQDHRENYRGFVGADITDPLKNWCVTFKKLITI